MKKRTDSEQNPKAQRGRVVPMRRNRRNDILRDNTQKDDKRKTKTKPAPKKKIHSIQETQRGIAINRSTSFVAGLFFVAVSIFLIRSLIAFATTPEIPVERIRMGSIDNIQLIEGIIIRDETVYTAEWDGVMQFYVRRYDRVRPGTTVGSIQNIEAVAEARQSLSQVEERFMLIQDSRRSISNVDPAVQDINRQLQNTIDNRLSNHINLNMSDVFSLRDDISQSVNVRNQMIVSDNLGLRPELDVSYGRYMGHLGDNLRAITVEKGGILAPVVDGLESSLNFDNMYNLTREQTRQYIDFDRLIPSRDVNSGDDVFKIVNSNRWYIAAYLPNDLVEGILRESNLRTLFVEGRRPLAVQVHHISHGFQESFVIFRSTAYMIDFLDTRNLSFRMTDVVQQGLRIANSAIAELDFLAIPHCVVHGEQGQHYVIRVLGYETFRIPIDIRERDDNYVYVSVEHDYLSLGNTLRERENLAATRTISRVETIKGVFRADTGLATFVPIVLSEEGVTGGVYSILDPIYNPRLREHNHIVTNASLVSDGDIIFSGVR